MEFCTSFVFYLFWCHHVGRLFECFSFFLILFKGAWFLVHANNLLWILFFLRRDLAPYLKSLMGPWWFSQFDTVPEVSLAAKRSLEVCYHFIQALEGCHCFFCYKWQIRETANKIADRCWKSSLLLWILKFSWSIRGEETHW